LWFGKDGWRFVHTGPGDKVQGSTNPFGHGEAGFLGSGYPAVFGLFWDADVDVHDRITVLKEMPPVAIVIRIPDAGQIDRLGVLRIGWRHGRHQGDDA
jgi:hypothetical protein